jgi:hypothetical protein
MGSQYCVSLGTVEFRAEEEAEDGGEPDSSVPTERRRRDSNRDLTLFGERTCAMDSKWRERMIYLVCLFLLT